MTPSGVPAVAKKAKTSSRCNRVDSQRQSSTSTKPPLGKTLHFRQHCCPPPKPFDFYVKPTYQFRLFTRGYHAFSVATIGGYTFENAMFLLPDVSRSLHRQVADGTNHPGDTFDHLSLRTRPVRSLTPSAANIIDVHPGIHLTWRYIHSGANS